MQMSPYLSIYYLKDLMPVMFLFGRQLSLETFIIVKDVYAIHREVVLKLPDFKP